MFKFNHIRFAIQVLRFAISNGVWRLANLDSRGPYNTWRYNFYDHVAGLSWHYNDAFAGFDHWTQKRMREMTA